MGKSLRVGVYASSFDPLTTGHLWMIEEGVKVFDRLIVGIGVNPEKRYTFSIEERVAMVKASTRQFKNLKVEAFGHQFLIKYAESLKAGFILRGIRSESDYEFERVMRNINGDLNEEITTVFLMPPRGIAEISSSMVKGLIGPAGWEKIVKEYVPQPVNDQLLQRFHERRSA
jgi:pantetheine-phosphate adenylyltransferase